MLLVIFRNIAHRYIFGRKSGNLHGNIGQALLDRVVNHIGIRFHDNADPSAAVRIGNHASMICDNLLESSDVQVLADRSDLLDQSFLNCLGRVCIPRLSQESVHIGRIGFNRLLRNRVNEILEGFILCNEVGFGVHFHDSRRVVVLQFDAAKSLRRNSSSLLLSLCLAVFSQVFHGRIHIAVCLIQRLLAVHHARAGNLS